MDITIFAGKGGVGKSTSAAAYAFEKSNSGKVLTIDYDGGHSFTRVLSIPKVKSNQITPTGIENLDLTVIDPIQFKPITEYQSDGRDIQEYLNQFQGDSGLIPLCDMVTTFFGVPTDIPSVSRFTSLIDMYHQARKREIDNLVIDVEPTAGLERLFNSTEVITRSMKNLQDSGWMTLKVLGTKWPDLSAYLKGEYIKNANQYAKRLTQTFTALKKAKYFIVCNPASSPIDEMEDVESIINSYNGKIVGYIINNIRGEPHEAAQIERIYKKANNFPVIKVNHDIRLCDSNPDSRKNALREVGSSFTNK